ncbi:F0F1 ATP synthase subunit B family protein [Rickettsiales endosymbiont of Stachyamoeba lipophora]|uniref:F0F1 ATP synthase subunit B family protein n=1 Tax=Rickettsiales endosymbiont of Stachyamoeba lipophora TaxID=2486578 RepID=UPI000F6496D1|nr:hypothetical protein [Rickettsiales endosymbiont of Stachyamoeba lipophora]AZL15748.1 hypothetical protein EF513_04205 [Rickettsiales endosymbiont of Stachyamoeba lipophora]
MIKFDETFWVGISVLLFVGLVFKPIQKLLKKYIDNRITEVQNQLAEAEQLKRDAEELLTKYLQKQQDIENEIKKLYENAEKEIKKIHETAENNLLATLKQKSEQAIQRINQYETTILTEVRNQAVEIAFLAIKSIIRERMSIEDSEKLLDSVINDLDNRIN